MEKHICDDCIAKYHSFHQCCVRNLDEPVDKKYTCTSCSRYYRNPTTIGGWVKYFLMRLRYKHNSIRFSIWRMLALFKFEYFGKRIPSCIKRGDVLEWAYSSDIRKLEKGADIHSISHKEKVDRVWVDYCENSDRFEVMAKLKSENGGGYSISTLNTLLNTSGIFTDNDNRKVVVTINGKRNLRFNMEYYFNWTATYHI